MLIWDEATLARVAKTIQEAVPDAEMEFTDEDWAELDRRRAEHLRGEGRSYTQKADMNLLRKARK